MDRDDKERGGQKADADTRSASATASSIRPIQSIVSLLYACGVINNNVLDGEMQKLHENNVTKLSHPSTWKH